MNKDLTFHSAKHPVREIARVYQMPDGTWGTRCLGTTKDGLPSEVQAAVWVIQTLAEKNEVLERAVDYVIDLWLTLSIYRHRDYVDKGEIGNESLATWHGTLGEWRERKRFELRVDLGVEPADSPLSEEEKQEIRGFVQKIKDAEARRELAKKEASDD